MGSYFKTALVSLVVSVLVVSAYHFFIFERKVPKIKYFDLTGYVSFLQSAYLSGKMSDSEVAETLKDIRAVLDRESQKGNIIILPKTVVINSELRGDAEIQYQNQKLQEAFLSMMSNVNAGNGSVGILPQFQINK